MRRIIVFALLLVMVASLAVPAFAAQGDLSMSDVSVQAGETVYLTVSLTKKVTGDTIGVTYTYDGSLLEPVAGSCQWLQQGTLQDFGAGNDSGVWAVDKAKTITGDICVLAFRVREEASFSETKVSCTVLIKNGSKKAGEFTAEATVSMGCDHSFGPWEQQGNAVHTRVCEKCSERQSQSHDWDDGTVTQDPENPDQNLKTRTCTVCDAKRTESVPAEEEKPGFSRPAEPTEPEETTVPEREEAPWRPDPNDTTFPDKERPDDEADDGHTTDTTRPGQDYGSTGSDDHEATHSTVWQPRDYNTPDAEEQEAEQDPAHDLEDLPIAIPAGDGDSQQTADATEDPHEGHSHTQQPEGMTAIVVCVFVLALGVGVGIYLKRKRR